MSSDALKSAPAPDTFPGAPLNENEASKMTGYLGVAMVVAGSSAGVNLIRQKLCVEGVSAMTVGILGTLLMFGGLTTPDVEGTENAKAYSLAAQFIAIIFIALAFVRILTIVRNCPGYSIESVAKGMKCQAPSAKMERGIGEFITGVIFLCSLFILAQNKGIASEVSKHINALRDSVKDLAGRFGGAAAAATAETEGEQGGGKRKQMGGAEGDDESLGTTEGDGEAGGSGILDKIKGGWLPLTGVILLLMVIAIGFGTNNRVGWITSTVLAVLIFIVLSVVFLISKIQAAESSERGRGKILQRGMGALVAGLGKIGNLLRDYAAGVSALILTTSGMGLIMSGSSSFNQGCAQQTAG
jgi:hypothetical protein